MSEPLFEIEARMANGRPFTYAELCVLARLHGNHENRSRLCDKTVQRWRRRGLISFTREGRSAVWRLTDAGRVALGWTNTRP